MTTPRAVEGSSSRLQVDLMFYQVSVCQISQVTCKDLAIFPQEVLNLLALVRFKVRVDVNLAEFLCFQALY